MRDEYEPTRLAGTEPTDEGRIMTVSEQGEMIPAQSSPQQFAVALEEEAQKRQSLERYLQSAMKEGVDWGTIPLGRNRTSKPCLFKPGAEKVCAMLKLRATFVKDSETMEMLPERDGTLAYVCQLVTPAGEIAAEGRGACEASERPHVNVRIKIAMKRAQVDAVLRVAALSDHYTQDLEDLPRDTFDRPAAPRPATPQEAWVPEGCKVLFAKYDGVCDICGKDIAKGQEQLYSTNSKKAMHVPCAKADILGDGPPPAPSEPDDGYPEDLPF